MCDVVHHSRDDNDDGAASQSTSWFNGTGDCGEVMEIPFVKRVPFVIQQLLRTTPVTSATLSALQNGRRQFAAQFPTLVHLVQLDGAISVTTSSCGMDKCLLTAGAKPLQSDTYFFPPHRANMRELQFWSYQPEYGSEERTLITKLERHLKALKVLGAVELIGFHEPEYQDVSEIRKEVFVKEQGVPEDEEFDEYEEKSDYLVYRDEKSQRVVGTCRLRISGPYLKLERVAVRKDFRSYGIGRILSEAVVRYAEVMYPEYIVVAHVQSRFEVSNFYAQTGNIFVSMEFLDEVDINHYTVICPPRLPMVRRRGDVEMVFWRYFEERQYAGHEFMTGNCYDPHVLQDVHSLLLKIKDLDYVHLSRLRYLLDEQELGRGIVKQFSALATSVMMLQAETVRRRSDVTNEVHFVAKPLDVDNEATLLAMAWDKLNTGNFAEVSEQWRLFYSAVSFVKAVRLAMTCETEKALEAADMGLLMGRDHPDMALAEWSEKLARTLPPKQLPVAKESMESEDSTPSRLANSIPIPHVESVTTLSGEDFMIRYLCPGMPVLIKGVASEWPAFQKWSFNYLHSLLAYRTVPVEFGSKYTEEDWKQKLTKGDRFFRDVLEPSEEVLRTRWPMYLAQHGLLNQIPTLLDDISAPEYCLSGSSDESDIDFNIWIGPRGTVSPLHQDPRENLFCQVRGRKFVRLVSPRHSAAVYANEEGILTNSSQVDVERPDLARFPRFADAICYDVVVEPGDALFIPKQWWHHVRSLTPSVSLSCWFDL